HRPGENFLLGNDGPRRNQPGYGIGGGVRRMAMNDGPSLRNCLINLKVQQNFTRMWPFAAYPDVIHVDQRQILGREVALAAHRGSADRILVPDTIGDIAAVALNVLPLPKLSSYADDLGFEARGFGRVVDGFHSRLRQ